MKDLMIKSLSTVGLIAMTILLTAYASIEQNSVFKVGHSYKTVLDHQIEFKVLEPPINNWTKVEETNAFGTTKVYYLNLSHYKEIQQVDKE